MPKKNARTPPSVTKTTRFLVSGLVFATLFLCFCDSANARTTQRKPAQNNRYAAVIMDAQTGKVLSSDHADSPRFPASLTKMMTLFLTFEALDRGKIHINKYLDVSPNAMNQPPSKLGIHPSRPITVKQAILALVTRSANDVAMAMAETIGGTQRGFAALMNERAKSLGMRNTVFYNPSGLPDPRQKTTARDIATLARALMQYFPHHYHYFGTKSFVYRGTIITTHNNLMRRFKGMDGLKTGYIGASGFNLAASAVRNNRRVIVVVFGGKTALRRDNHVADLLNRGFTMVAREKLPIQVAAAGKTTPTPIVATAPITTELSNPTKPGQAMVKPAASQQATQQLVNYLPIEDRAPPIGQDMAPQAIDGGWGIQVGAYGSEALGMQALDVARGILTGLPPQAQGVVLPAQTPQGLVYRARFLGLSAEDASAACKRLRECMVFAMH